MKNVLLLEDNKSQLDYMSKIIKDTFPDIKTYAASSYKEAIDLIREITDFDFFILDIDLGDTPDQMDGLDFANYIRGLDEYELKPLIYVTSVSERLAEALNTTHCYDYILKPYKEEDITNVVDKILRMPEPAPAFIDLPGLNGGRIHVLIKDIVYIESYKHEIVIHTPKVGYRSKASSLKKTLALLPDYFIQCHRSYIFNSRLSTFYDTKNHDLTIEGADKKLAVGRKYRDYFMASQPFNPIDH